MPEEQTQPNTETQPQTPAEPSPIDKANETLKQIQEAEKRVDEKMKTLKEEEQRISNAILAGRANAGQVQQETPAQKMADEMVKAFHK